MAYARVLLQPIHCKLSLLVEVVAVVVDMLMLFLVLLLLFGFLLVLWVPPLSLLMLPGSLSSSTISIPLKNRKPVGHNRRWCLLPWLSCVRDKAASSMLVYCSATPRKSLANEVRKPILTGCPHHHLAASSMDLVCVPITVFRFAHLP